MADVLVLGGGRCVIYNDRDWWVVGSDVDWLKGPHSVEYLFGHVVAAPRHGLHSMRGEVLLTAFASAVTVVDDGNGVPVFGGAPESTVLDGVSGIRRAIVFVV
jgi:hypothetical protein